jgi:hypothetical protein
MARVVPSQVVQVIDAAYPGILNRPPQAYDHGHGPGLRALVEVARQVPTELFTGASDFTDFTLCISVIEEQLQRWLMSGTGQVRGFTGRFDDPIQKMHEILLRCRDEPLPHNPSMLRFIVNRQLRDSILRDVRGSDDALAHGEWKAATVLAGAAIEALLHWRLGLNMKAQRQAAGKAAVSAKLLTREPDNNLDRWGLDDLIEVAGQSGLLKEDTLAVARQTKNFRNLIHPGKAKRLAQECNRSTALVAVAALERVIDELRGGARKK